MDTLAKLFELHDFDAQLMLEVTFAIAITAVYLWVSFNFFQRIRERSRQRDKELLDAISGGLRKGILENLDDFIDLYRGVYQQGADDVSYSSGLSRVLRSYLVEITKRTGLDAKEARLQKTKISEILRAIDIAEPFADLPSTERNLVLDVQRFIASGDIQLAGTKLEDLAGHIEIRQDAMERLQKSNRWSIPLAGVGLVLTLVFGVISLVK